jgi:AcrR family transcriptional regulator
MASSSSSPSSPSAPPHARLRDRLREETSRAILAAAEDVFASDGLSARMESIAAHAGVAVGTLYNHFEDRKALVAALVRSRREALLSRLDAALADARGEPVAAQLRAYLSAVEQHARAHGPLLHVLMQAGEGPGETRPPRTLLEDLVRRAQVILDRAVADGELRPDPAKVFALALVGMARALVLRTVEGGTEPGQATEALLALFLQGAAPGASR